MNDDASGQLPPVSDPIEEGLRRLGIAGAAGVVAGLLVGGIGGRIVMRISAIAADIDGVLTEGGNRVGDVTVDGTIALVIFGGGLFGLVGGMVLFVVHPWLRGNLALRSVTFAIALPAMVASALIAAENRDFLILDPPELNIAMFLAIFVVFGGAVVVAYEWMLDLVPSAPPVHTDARSPSVVQAALAIPSLFVPALLLADAKLAEALFLLVAGIATSVRLAYPPSLSPRSGLERLSSWVGPSAVAATAIAGAISLASEIERIV